MQKLSFKRWFESHTDEKILLSELHVAYAEAFLHGAIRPDESFKNWCRWQYGVYRDHPDGYRPPYSRLFT